MTLSTSLLGDLQVLGTPEQAATLQALAARAAVYATRARGDGTRRSYRSAWRAYEVRCSGLGRISLRQRQGVALLPMGGFRKPSSLLSLRRQAA